MTKKIEYSSAVLEQIKEALRKYAADHGIKSAFYHLEIKNKLGLRDDDPRLHSSDPRHWLKSNGHMPNQTKIELYTKFVCMVYPDLNRRIS